MTTSDNGQWEHPPFMPSASFDHPPSGEPSPAFQEPPLHEEPPKWYRRPWVVLIGIVAAGVTGYTLNGPRSESTDLPPAPSASTTPFETPMTPGISPQGTPSVTSSAQPSPTMAPSKPNASSAYPKVATLQGKVGYIPRTSHEGTLWGKAATSSNINFIDLSCANGYPESNLVVMSKRNKPVETFQTDRYIKTSAGICDGDEVKLKSVSVAYVALLNAALIENKR